MSKLLAIVGFCSALGACSSDGVSDLARTEGQAIAGGTTDALDSEVVAIFREYSPIIVDSACTGTLIAPNVVLTARHCIETFSGLGCATKFNGQVYPHVWVTTAADSSESSLTLYKAAKVLRPNTDAAFCGNDLALIVLIDSIPATEAVPRAPLVDGVLSPGQKFSAVGYGGVDQKASGKGIRRRYDGAGVACVGATCTSEGIGPEWIGSAPLCGGDSGGPALDAQGRVAGVASRGDCSAAVYIRSECFASFLIASVTDAANQAGYPAPAWTNQALTTPNPSCASSTGTGGAGTGGSSGSGTGGSAGASTGGDGGFAGSAGSAAGGAAGSGGAGSGGAEPANNNDSVSGCGCRLEPHSGRRGLTALLLGVALAWLQRRRARRTR